MGGEQLHNFRDKSNAARDDWGESYDAARAKAAQEAHDEEVRLAQDADNSADHRTPEGAIDWNNADIRKAITDRLESTLQDKFKDIGNENQVALGNMLSKMPEAYVNRAIIENLSEVQLKEIFDRDLQAIADAGFNPIDFKLKFGGIAIDSSVKNRSLAHSEGMTLTYQDRFNLIKKMGEVSVALVKALYDETDAGDENPRDVNALSLRAAVNGELSLMSELITDRHMIEKDMEPPATMKEFINMAENRLLVCVKDSKKQAVMNAMREAVAEVMK